MIKLLVATTLIGVAIATSSWIGASATTTPALSDAELAGFRIIEARDVTMSTTSELVAYSRDDAITGARAQIGSTQPDVRVLRGRAARFPGEQLREVWVILFAGGDSPFDGPIGAPPTTYRVTGVIIDAETGEFLRGFMT